MKYKHFCHVDPQGPNITLVGLFIIQRVQVYVWLIHNSLNFENIQ